MKRTLVLIFLISIIATFGIGFVAPVQAADSQPTEPVEYQTVDAVESQIELSQTDANSPPPPTNSPVSPGTEEKIKFRKQTIRTMKEQVEQTTSSVQAGNYGAARKSFESALKKWYTFGGTIKRLSPETYTKVAAEFKTVNNSIDQSSPQKTTLVANLQALTRDLSAAVKISDAND
ncbi:MAG: hypothetical protein KME35_04925 [Aphanocapsa sp. GSE-SYN-MK-11-07L]|jgi:hypothetical protein|nr:hypothetical protein [Aphanocapsa sp. GSE-SYN-MK-11-07L]